MRCNRAVSAGSFQWEEVRSRRMRTDVRSSSCHHRRTGKARGSIARLGTGEAAATNGRPTSTRNRCAAFVEAQEA